MAVYSFAYPETSVSPSTQVDITTKIIKGKILYAIVHFPIETEYKLWIQLSCGSNSIMPVYGSASKWIVLDGTTTVALIWWNNTIDSAELKLTIKNYHDTKTFAPTVIVNVMPPEEFSI
jgi:hypothetical protein